MKALTDKIMVSCNIIAQRELGFDELFDLGTSFQESFLARVRQQVETVLFSNWSTCGGARDGKVEYDNVETACFGEMESFDVVIVDYYHGTVAGYGRVNRTGKLSMRLSVEP